MTEPALNIRRVSPKPTAETWQHGVIWHGVDEIVVELGEVHWYGGGGLIHQQWPLEKLAQYRNPFITSDNGVTGLLGTLEPFWWTSTGAGLVVEGDMMEVGFNPPLKGEPPSHSFQNPYANDQRPMLASTTTADSALHISGKNLSIRFFNLNSPRAVVEAFWQLYVRLPPAPDHLFGRPLWTTWAHFKNDITHEGILDYARQIQLFDFPPVGVFGIDAKWQQQFGDSHFDRQKFPMPDATIADLHEKNMPVTLWSAPFFMRDSEHFQTAVEQGFVIQKSDGTPYIGEWWEGEAAFLDITNPVALEWYLGNLAQLANETGVDGFKFDAGEAMFFMDSGLRWYDNGPPNRATQIYVEYLARHYPWSDVRTGWRNQLQPMLFRQWDKSTRWGFDNGLASAITQAMTLNLLGYPFSFPDMIGGNEYGDQRADAELLVRWTQAVAPMPFIQFSIAPWREGADCARLCARYAHLNAELADCHRQLASQSVPVVRPLWWLAPDDETALTCDDEYLVGDELLVAPVIHPGQTARDIYLPPGEWRSYWNKDETHSGERWLRDYPAPLEVLPLFVKM